MRYLIVSRTRAWYRAVQAAGAVWDETVEATGMAYE